jgi:cell division protein FtsB
MKATTVVGVLAALALAHAALGQETGVRRWWHLRGELAEARGRIEALRQETQRLAREAQRLEADEFALERAIREELGLAKPGQTLVRLRGGDVSSAGIR